MCRRIPICPQCTNGECRIYLTKVTRSCPRGLDAEEEVEEGGNGSYPAVAFEIDEKEQDEDRATATPALHDDDV